MDELTDPLTLTDRADVDVVERTPGLTAEEAAEVREAADSWTSHAAVGVTDDAGRVLLADDGHHGWTLPAGAVEDGDDYVAAGREQVESLLDAPVEVAGAERVRSTEYRGPDGDHVVTVHNVILRAEPESTTDLPESPTNQKYGESGWFDAVPEDVPEGIAADARLFLD